LLRCSQHQLVGALVQRVNQTAAIFLGKFTLRFQHLVANAMVNFKRSPMKRLAPLPASDLRLPCLFLLEVASGFAMGVLKGQPLFIDRLLEALGQTES
jgi:hypothetical protein